MATRQSVSVVPARGRPAWFLIRFFLGVHSGIVFVHRDFPAAGKPLLMFLGGDNNIVTTSKSGLASGPECETDSSTGLREKCSMMRPDDVL